MSFGLGFTISADVQSLCIIEKAGLSEIEEHLETWLPWAVNDDKTIKREDPHNHRFSEFDQISSP